MSTDSTSTLERTIHATRNLLASGEFTKVLNDIEPILERYPHNRDALYLKAVALRYLKRLTEALSVLDDLKRYHPQFSLQYQERGHCYVDLRDADRAVRAFMHAVNINPALPASWNKLQALHRMRGEQQNAEMAAQHIATLARLPSPVVVATGLFSDGDYAPAELIARQYLEKHPEDVEMTRLLARIGLAMDVLDDGEELLAKVLARSPNYHAARYDYVRALLARHKHALAKIEMEKLLATDPKNRNYRFTYGTVLVGLGLHREALAIHITLLEELGPEPSQSDSEASIDPYRERSLLLLSIGHTYKTLGEQVKAIDAYEHAARIRVDFGDAYWSLANLKTYQFKPEMVALMRSQESQEGIDLQDRYHLCFAIAKALEDHGDYAQSFLYYKKGNALKEEEHRFNIKPIERNTRDQIKVCTADFFESRRGAGMDNPDPIFVVGLPRSGSTLIEQILSSHSKVEGTAELAEIARIVLELTGRDMSDEYSRYPECLTDLNVSEYQRLAQGYLAQTRAYRVENKPFFIDKMPNNFRHIGLIHLLFPNAKIIDARREPMACCFSNFKQLFASGQEFTYSIDNIARYYRTYLELMDHWDRVLPNRVLRVQHETLVDNFEAEVRRILDYCGLEFESSCMEFYKTKRSIRTASSEQVRQPLFRDGLDHWKHFEPWLGELKSALLL